MRPPISPSCPINMPSNGIRWAPALPRPLCCSRWWSPAATYCCASGIAQLRVLPNEHLADAPASLRSATGTTKGYCRMVSGAPALRAEHRHCANRDRADRLDGVPVRLDSADVTEEFGGRHLGATEVCLPADCGQLRCSVPGKSLWTTSVSATGLSAVLPQQCDHFHRRCCAVRCGQHSGCLCTGPVFLSLQELAGLHFHEFPVRALSGLRDPALSPLPTRWALQHVYWADPRLPADHPSIHDLDAAQLLHGSTAGNPRGRTNRWLLLAGHTHPRDPAAEHARPRSYGYPGVHVLLECVQLSADACGPPDLPRNGRSDPVHLLRAGSVGPDGGSDDCLSPAAAAAQPDGAEVHSARPDNGSSAVNEDRTCFPSGGCQAISSPRSEPRRDTDTFLAVAIRPPRMPLGRNKTTPISIMPIQKYQYWGFMPERRSRATM